MTVATWRKEMLHGALKQRKDRWKVFEEHTMQVLLCVAIVVLCYLSYRSFILPLQFPDDYSEKLMLEFCGAILAVIVVSIVVARRMSEKSLYVMGWILIVAAGAVQLCIADQMQLIPECDLIFTINQDIEMVENGEHFFTDVSYFSGYTNNIPLTILIYWVFRLAKVIGVQNYELAGGVFNVVMNLVTYSMGYAIVRRASGIRTAFLFSVILVTNPTLYAYASYYYTDTISLAFTSVAIYLFVRGYQTMAGITYGANECNATPHVRKIDSTVKKRRHMKYIYIYILSGIFLYIGYKIRVTSMFIMIAGVLYFLFKRRGRQLLKVLIPCGMGILIAVTLYSGIYGYHINFDTKDSAIPWQHFLAMGADRETTGRYNHGDYIETCSLRTHEEKVSYNLQKWKSRVKENGLYGGWRLICDKEATVWSYGSKQYYQYLQWVKDKNPIYDWLVGEHCIYFKCYMQGYNSLLLLGMIVSLIIALRKKRLDSMTCIVVITWLGAVMFYVLWEAHPRQSVSYLLVMSLMLIPMVKCVLRERG